MQQTHVQANPGQSIQVEWATGHSGSTGSFVLVDAEDEALLLQYSDKVMEEYLNQAPSTSLQESYQVSMRGEDIGKKKQDGKNSCMKNGNSFSGEIPREKAHKRPLGFRTLLKTPGNERFWAFNPEIPEECRKPKYAAYTNKKYPWIKAVLGYKITVHLPQDAQISTFPIPLELPSKKYILHWYWRGYFDCTDVNIVDKSKKVTDMWGTNVGDPVFIRTDHCFFWNVSRWCKDGDKCGSGHYDGLKAAEADRAQALKELPKVQQKAIAPASARITAEQHRNQTYDANIMAKEVYTKAKEKKEKATSALNEARSTGDKTLMEEAKELKSKAGEAGKTALKALATSSKELKTASKTYQAAVKKDNAAQRELKRVVERIQDTTHKLEWGTNRPSCVLIPAGSDDMTECQATCGTSGNECKLQVIPVHRPTTSLFGDPVMPTACKDHPNVVGKVKEGDRLCFKIKEGNPNDSGPAYDVTTDPEDPVWYSTCYTKQSSPDIRFTGNTCGDSCLLNSSVTRAVWRYEDKCISCADAIKNKPNDTTYKILPSWKPQEHSCTRC